MAEVPDFDWIEEHLTGWLDKLDHKGSSAYPTEVCMHCSFTIYDIFVKIEGVKSLRRIEKTLDKILLELKKGK